MSNLSEVQKFFASLNEEAEKENEDKPEVTVDGDDKEKEVSEDAEKDEFDYNDLYNEEDETAAEKEEDKLDEESEEEKEEDKLDEDAESETASEENASDAAATLPEDEIKEDADKEDEDKLDEESEEDEKLDEELSDEEAEEKLKQEEDELTDAEKEKLEESKKAQRAKIVEQVKTLFKDQKLSPKAINQMVAVFEAAVADRAHAAKKAIYKSYSKKLSEAYRTMDKQVTRYADFAATQFIKENKLAVENGLKVQLAENVLAGMKKVLSENSITVADKDVALVTKLQADAKATAKKINESKEREINLSKQVVKLSRQVVLDESAKDLTVSQKEKLTKLVEGVNFTSPKQFSEAVASVKEKFITVAAAKVPAKKLAESRTLDESVKEYTNFIVDRNKA